MSTDHPPTGGKELKITDFRTLVLGTPWRNLSYLWLETDANLIGIGESRVVCKTHTVLDVDGVRVLFENGWGLLRASNTQPVLVMRFEASSQEALRSYQNEVEAVLDEAKSAVA
jgi:phosphomannomutase